MNRYCSICQKYEDKIINIESKLALIRINREFYTFNDILLEALNILLEIERKRLEQLTMDKNIHLLRHD